MRTALVVLSLVLGAAAGGLSLRRAHVPAAQASVPALPSMIRAEGRVTTHPNASVVVGTERSGTLATFSIRERTSVKRGELVAELEGSEDRAALAEARARVRETDVSIAFLGKQVGKSRRLVEVGAVAKDDLERTQQQLDAAVAARAALAASVLRITAAAEKAKIRAPMDGVVLERHAEEGQIVSAGARLFTMADLGKLRVEAEVDEFDAPRVRVGAPVVLTAEGLEGTVRGTVEEIPLAITPRRIRPEDPTRPSDTRVLLVKIAVQDPARLRLGQRVEVALER